MASAGPTPKKNGTSIPIPTASSIKRARVHRSFQRRLRPHKAAAASLEPPPRPAATGIRFLSSILAPASTLAASFKSLAARMTRLRSSVGKSGSSELNESVGAASSVNRSYRSTACMTVTTS